MKERYPNRINAHVLKSNDWPSSNVPGTDYWGPARPVGYPGFLERIRTAWDVFTGRADALYWDKPGTVDARWEDGFLPGDTSKSQPWHD